MLGTPWEFLISSRFEKIQMMKALGQSWKTWILALELHDTRFLRPIYETRKADYTTVRVFSNWSIYESGILLQWEEINDIIAVKKEILLFLEGSLTTAFVLATLSASLS